ncbi:MAG: hypothetical protein ACE5I8_00390 [Thermodesulfobacteriota bacterium]
MEQQRELTAPSAIEGEKIHRFGQAAFDGGSPFKSVWKPGYLYLTGKRLLFFQGERKVVEIFLRMIRGVTVIRRNFIPAKVVDQLCLIEQNGKRKRAYYFFMKKPQPWMDAVEKLPRE